jgi:hypothetical protein
MNPCREEFGEATGEFEFIFQAVDGTRQRVTLRVGKPYLAAPGEWACPGELSGFEPRHPDMRGVSSMQALCLAISLLRSRVEGFLAKGGKVFDVADGTEWDARGISATFGRVGNDVG